MIPLPRGITLPYRSYLDEDSVPIPVKQINSATVETLQNPVTIETTVTTIDNPRKPVTTEITVKSSSTMTRANSKPNTTNAPAKSVEISAKPMNTMVSVKPTSTEDPSKSATITVPVKPGNIKAPVQPVTNVKIENCKVHNNIDATVNCNVHNNIDATVKILKRVPLAPVNKSGDLKAPRSEDKLKIHPVQKCEVKSGANISRRWKRK